MSYPRVCLFYYHYLGFKRIAKLPSSLYETGLDNVLRSEFPQSVLNTCTGTAHPAPAARPANDREDC